MRVPLAAFLAGLLILSGPACEGTDGNEFAGRPFSPRLGDDPVVAAAGGISCPGAPCRGQRDTAALLTRIDATAVLALGDNQYAEGALSDFVASYDPTWGRFIEVTHPVPGNHEYRTVGAQGYFDYFGRRAHEQGGWYSFELGTWHLVAINSGPGIVSAQQLSWIEADLAEDDQRCELAFWHHPRWSSGTVDGMDPDPELGPLWTALFTAGVDVVVNGHHHNYERFAPLDATGRLHPSRGIRQFVAGTAGRSLHPFGEPLPGSQRRITDTFGVLELTLRERSYAWRFISTDGTVLDEGNDVCHA